MIYIVLFLVTFINMMLTNIRDIFLKDTTNLQSIIPKPKCSITHIIHTDCVTIYLDDNEYRSF